MSIEFQIPQGYFKLALAGYLTRRLPRFKSHRDTSNLNIFKVFSTVSSFKSHRDTSNYCAIPTIRPNQNVSNPIGILQTELDAPRQSKCRAFQIPQGYFKLLSMPVQSQYLWSFKSHRDTSNRCVLVGVLSKITFQIPQGYFKQIKRAKLMVNPLFQIPQGYFKRCLHATPVVPLPSFKSHRDTSNF